MIKRASLLLALTLGACPPCDYKVLKEVPSPSHRMIAVVYEGDCGATTDFARSVAIRKASDQLNPTNGLVVGGPGQPSLNATWENESTLVVSLPKDFEARVKKDALNGVAIRYAISE